MGLHFVPIHIDIFHRTKVLNGVSDCADGSDECPDQKAFEDNPLSSRDQLIKFPLFQVMIWLIGIIATIGNLVVFTSASKTILKMQLASSSCPVVEKWLLKNNQGKFAGRSGFVQMHEFSGHLLRV